MIKVFSASADAFSTMGLGAIQPLLCTVTEEVNGEYTLRLEYPANGEQVGVLIPRNIVVCKPDPYSDPQPFRIVTVSKPMRGRIAVRARHISYDLSGYAVSPFSASSLADALQKIPAFTTTEMPFEFSTEISSEKSFDVSVPRSVRSLLGGQTGSLIDVYGGEWAFDGFSLTLSERRGADRGFTIDYGKNMTSLVSELDRSTVYSAVFPYWKNEAGEMVTIPGYTRPVPGVTSHVNVLVKDFSSEFQSAPSISDLSDACDEYISKNNLAAPADSWTVSFVPLDKASGYEHLSLHEHVELGDTVRIRYPDIDLVAQARIVSATYDVLTDRFETLIVGRVRATIADSMAGQAQKIEQLVTPVEALTISATIAKALNGNAGGSVRLLDRNNDGMPDELYIADDADPEEAENVWRFNSSGWGASSSGYDGPFTMGATLTGGLMADFIRGGEIDGDVVKARNLLVQGFQLDPNPTIYSTASALRTALVTAIDAQDTDTMMTFSAIYAPMSAESTTYGIPKGFNVFCCYKHVSDSVEVTFITDYVAGDSGARPVFGQRVISSGGFVVLPEFSIKPNGVVDLHGSSVHLAGSGTTNPRLSAAMRTFGPFYGLNSHAQTDVRMVWDPGWYYENSAERIAMLSGLPALDDTITDLYLEVFGDVSDTQRPRIQKLIAYTTPGPKRHEYIRRSLRSSDTTTPWQPPLANLQYSDASQSADLAAGSWHKIGEVTYEGGGYTRGAVFGIVITGRYSTRQPQSILAVCVASYNYLSLIKIGSTDTAYKPFDQMRVCRNDNSETVDIEIHVEASTSSGVAAGNGTRVRILQLSDCAVSAKPFSTTSGKTVKSTITL